MLLRLAYVLVLQPTCIDMMLIAMMTGVSSVRANIMSADVVIVMLLGVFVVCCANDCGYD